MNCPHCGKTISPAAMMGKLGGAAGTGKVKARASAQARRAVLARWKKYRVGKRASAI